MIHVRLIINWEFFQKFSNAYIQTYSQLSHDYCNLLISNDWLMLVRGRPCICEGAPHPVCRGAAARGSRRPAPLCPSRRRCGWRWGRVCASGGGCGPGAGNIRCCSAAWDTSPGPTPPASWESTEDAGEHSGDPDMQNKHAVLWLSTAMM